MSQYPTHTYPPPAPPRPTNGLGVAGFIVSLVGIFCGCILCPVGLLLSFVALFKAPRGFAVAGFILGLIGTVIPLLVLSFFGFMIFAAISAGRPGVETFFTIVVDGQQAITKATEANANVLPEDADGNAALAPKHDGWGRSLRYHKRSESSYEIRSAGADGAFDTSDDLDIDFPAPRALGRGGTSLPAPPAHPTPE